MKVSFEELRRAKEDWVEAMGQEMVADRDFIEAAIYHTKAAESKYNALLARAKAEGLCSETQEGDKPLISVGTKSLLFGVHQFLVHPITVALAWKKLYGEWPTWREMFCIIVHDWGYWGKPNMDGIEGEMHPCKGAKIAGKLLGQEYFDLCILHSRHYAKLIGRKPSKLCWADKYCVQYEPMRFYLLRARLTGELKEYRGVSAKAGFIPLSASDREWFEWIKHWTRRIGEQQIPDTINVTEAR